ncbi:hypothetical protein KFL_000300440 [Klebsormidium nitens]|uniref:Uncharacterized protein n=1 Tax=Klebsormidium nitens TaxID=105231 RepID=A0A0U9HII2_KLENI|nr:hypothetical protein KFL_000300440 [Klebsormidium nitens]|eukprot:GAQ79446.1 hypothetical protein KFL_000300440 [Klebsormidium nitens]
MATMTAAARQTVSSVSGLAHLSGASHLTQGAAACPSSRIFPSVQGSRTRQPAARSVIVRAAENESEGGQTEVRPLGRGGPSSDNRRWGYTEFDSAGQKNIYAVEPKIYVADNAFSTGKKGTEGQGSSTLVFLGIGAAVAVGAVASLNLLGNAPSAAPSAAISTVAGVDVPPLSFYIEKFSQTPSLDSASLPAPEVSSKAIASAAEVIPEAAVSAE